ncbi:MAG: EF-hand domain-containing protein [Kiritimatiellaceae bacterium]|nr:EF-hand domain-containing protein [Kiritimatiellaceae bacterium]
MKLYVLILSVVLFSVGAQAAALVFADTDKNSDGLLSKEEFVAGHKLNNPKRTEADVQKLFATKDLNKDGSLTPKEFESDRK